MGIFENLKRALAASRRDDVSILAGSIAYFAFLAMVPLLAASILSYGLVADPAVVAGHIAAMAKALPDSATALIGDQLRALVETSAGAKSLALLASLAFAVFSARGSALAIIRAVAMAFNDGRRRGFVRLNLLALAIVLAGLAGGGLVIVALGFTSSLADYLPQLSGGTAIALRLLSYAILLAAAATGSALLYRRAPVAREPDWAPALRGGMISGAGVLVLTALFGFYVANFGSYNATYGSLGAVIVLLTWLYLSAYVLLFGAEVAATYMQAADA